MWALGIFIASTVLFLMTANTMLNALAFVDKHRISEHASTQRGAKIINDLLNSTTILSEFTSKLNSMYVYDLVVDRFDVFRGTLQLARTNESDRLLLHFNSNMIDVLILPSQSFVLVSVVQADNDSITFLTDSSAAATAMLRGMPHVAHARNAAFVPGQTVTATAVMMASFSSS